MRSNDIKVYGNAIRFYFFPYIYHWNSTYSQRHWKNKCICKNTYFLLSYLKLLFFHIVQEFLVSNYCDRRPWARTRHSIRVSMSQFENLSTWDNQCSTRLAEEPERMTQFTGISLLPCSYSHSHCTHTSQFHHRAAPLSPLIKVPDCLVHELQVQVSVIECLWIKCHGRDCGVD